MAEHENPSPDPTLGSETKPVYGYEDCCGMLIPITEPPLVRKKPIPPNQEEFDNY